MKLTKLFACVLAAAGMISCANAPKKSTTVDLPIAVQL